MGVTATTRLPAGWYPDPDGGEQRRWWDGQEWTQYTADFQRHTSVDELELDSDVPVTKAGKPAKASKAARRLRRVEAEETAEQSSATQGHSTAERIGRWLAGAVHFRPSTRKRRRAHRSSRSGRRANP